MRFDVAISHSMRPETSALLCAKTDATAIAQTLARARAHSSAPSTWAQGQTRSRLQAAPNRLRPVAITAAPPAFAAHPLAPPAYG